MKQLKVPQVPKEYPVPPKVTVVAAVYNKEATIGHFIRAFKEQSYGEAIEIILVDDVSEDDSREVVRQEMKACQEQAQNLQIRLIENQVNMGNCQSRLTGLKEATGDIVFVMDADCVVNQDFVYEHWKSHSAGFFHIVVGPMNVETHGRDPFRLLDQLSDDPTRLEEEMSLQDPYFRDSFLNNITRNFSIQKHLIGEDLFDTDFSYSRNPDSGFGWEDVDMGCRLYVKGLRTVYNPRAITVHVSHPSNVDESEKPVKSIKNFRLLLEKNPGLEYIACDWTKNTVDNIEKWLKGVSKEDNEDLAAVRKIIETPSVPFPMVRTATRRLKILSFRWHCGHQYELQRLPHDFVLAAPLTGMCCSWDYNSRPLRENVRMVPSHEINYDDFDLAILHFDELSLDPSLAGEHLGNDWGNMFRQLLADFRGPKIAICHGPPYYYGAYQIGYVGANLGKIVVEERRRVVDALNDVMVICNSHRAQRDWGFHKSRVIWHGLDPKEYQPAVYEKWAVCAVGAMIQRHYYRGLNLYLEVLHRLANIKGYPAPDFLGDRMCNQVTPDWPQPDDYPDLNRYSTVRFQSYLALLRKYSVFFNPTFNSPMPRTRADAMMIGLALVTTNYHDEDMFIENGVHGFLSNDPTEISQILIDLYHDRNLAAEIGRRGRERAMEVFHINDYINEWHQVISDTLGENFTPGLKTRTYRYTLKADKAVRSGDRGESEPSVLFISDESSATGRHRCDNMVEALTSAGVSCRRISTNNPEVLKRIPDAGKGHNIVVLHRVLADYRFPNSFLAELRRRGALIIYDVGGGMPFDAGPPELSHGQSIDRASAANAMDVFRHTLSYCDHVTCNSLALRTALACAGHSAYVVHDCYCAEMLRLSRLNIREVSKATDWVDVGLLAADGESDQIFSGVAELLNCILENCQNVRLSLVGNYQIPKILMPWKNRIISLRSPEWKKVPRLISRFHINLVPFNRSDSCGMDHLEARWLEAALLGVPTVCWSSEESREIIEDRHDGVLVSSEAEWGEALKELVANPHIREEIGRRCMEKAVEEFAPAVRGRELHALYKALLDRTS